MRPSSANPNNAHLGHNRLTTLPEGVFDGLTSLELLYLN